MSKWLSTPSNTLIILLITIVLSACDKGKKPYEEAEALFNKSDYDAALKKVDEVIQNAPNSKYTPQAKALHEKLKKIGASVASALKATQIGDYTAVIKSSEEILALDSNNAQVKEILSKLRQLYQRKNKLMEDGKAFIESGEYEKGIESYKAILTFLPNDKDITSTLDAIENDYPECCREEIKKYSARRKDMDDIRKIFLKEPSGENEFERKHAAKQILEEQRAISPKTVFFDSVYSVDISEYNFGKQEFKVGFGVRKGYSKGGEAYGIPDDPDVLQIANDKGQRIEFHLKMNEKDAALFDKEQKKHANLFVVYKFVKGEKFKYWNPLKAAAMRGLRGDHGYEEDARIYIKPIYVALLSGDKKITLYEAREK